MKMKMTNKNKIDWNKRGERRTKYKEIYNAVDNMSFENALTIELDKQGKLDLALYQYFRTGRRDFKVKVKRDRINKLKYYVMKYKYK